MKSLHHAFWRLGLALALGCQALAGGLAEPPPGSPFQDWLAIIRTCSTPLPDWIGHSSLLSYPARKPVYDPDGYPVPGPGGRQLTVPVTLTGRVFFPPAWRVPDGARLPLVLYSHATEMRRGAVPSAFDGDEWKLGAAAAACYGFAVAMPDQPGLGGDSTGYHPFCQARSLAYATLDSLPAIQRLGDQDPYLMEHRYGWSGELFMLGYSEGGYTTLASVKEWETHAGQYEAGSCFTLTGSACMAGPFDLSGSMRGTFIAPGLGYPRSYYLPYFVLGYHGVYGQAFDPDAVLAPALLETGPAGNILQWADGTRDGPEVDLEVGRRLGMPPDAINLRRLFNPLWLARELDDPAYATSRVHGLLAENDLYDGWVPTRPILFRQSPDDGNIPYANTLITLDRLGEAIRQAGGDPGALLLSLPIGRPGDHVSHLDGAYLALPSAFAWFYFGMPDLASMPAMATRIMGPIPSPQ